MRYTKILLVVVIVMFIYGELVYNSSREGGGVTRTWYRSSIGVNHSISSLTNNSITTGDRNMTSTATPIDRSIMGGNGQCRLLPRGSPSGTVEMCLDRSRFSGCRGVVKVTIADCLAKFKGDMISKNATLSEELKSLGPDTIRVRLSGPEVVAGIAKYTPLTMKGVVSCVYEYPFVVHSEGEYNIAVERLYSNYNGLNEAFDIWPPLMKEPLLRVNATRNRYHSGTRTLESFYFFTCDGLASNISSTASRTACTGLEKSTDGAWVKDPSDIIYTRIRVKESRRYLYIWALQKDSLYHWVPYVCSKSGISFSYFNKRFNGKKIAVTGDSQLGAVYFGLVYVLRGIGVTCVQNISTLYVSHLFKMPRGCTYDPNYRTPITGTDIQVDYIRDNVLSNFENTTFDDYDIIITGLAQHPASAAHWPFDRYRASVSSKANKIESLRRRNKTVVWYLSPQYPHRKKGPSVHFRDWRTDPRLMMFNGYAKDVFLSLGVPVVDGYAISTGMSHTSYDWSHYNNFVCYEAVHMLLRVLMSSLDKNE